LKFSFQKFVESEIELFFKFCIPLILILQLCLSGFALSFESNGDLALESCNHGNSAISLFYIEDTEGKGLSIGHLTLDIYDFIDLRLISVNTDLPGNYFCELNHSRSPPLV